jgi:hypothetical protein
VASPALLTRAQAPRGRALEARRRRLTLQAELSLERPLREVSSIRAEAATVNYHLGRTAASERRRYTLCMECSLQEAGGCAANPLCRRGALQLVVVQDCVKDARRVMCFTMQALRNDAVADPAAKARLDAAVARVNAARVDPRAPRIRLARTAECAACGVTSLRAELKCCTGCGDAFYCDEACQRAHWRAHKPTCRSKAAER